MTSNKAWSWGVRDCQTGEMHKVFRDPRCQPSPDTCNEECAAYKKKPTMLDVDYPINNDKGREI